MTSLTGVHQLAPCADEQPTFDAAADGDPDAIAAAKTICRGCDIRDACLAEALGREKRQRAANRWGIYGGLTATERTKSAGVITAPDRLCHVCGRKIQHPRGNQKYHQGTCSRVANSRRTQTSKDRSTARTAEQETQP